MTSDRPISSSSAAVPRTVWSLHRTRRTWLKDRFVHPCVPKHWPQCIAADAMGRDKLEALQQKRWRTLCRHVLEHVPFYREWAKSAGRTAEEEIRLEELPAVSKREHIDRPADFRSDAYPDRMLTPGRTSGSSGEPLRIMTHVEATDAGYAALLRGLLRHGIRPGDARVHIWGAHHAASGSAFVQHCKHRLRDWFNATLSISAYHLSAASMSDVIERIRRFRPVYMHGYVSSYFAMAKWLEARGERLGIPTLRLVVTDSEKLIDAQRELIARIFECRVVQHYGSVEFGTIAQEDPAGVLRINEDHLLVEQGAQGEAIITHLLHFAQPFIRYRVGDLIELDPEIAPGLPYRSLSAITGRVTDLLPLADGSSIHGLAVATSVYRGEPAIRRYQVRQSAIDHFLVRLVVDEPLSPERREALVARVRDKTGASTQVDIEEVAEIPPEPSGKFRLVVSDIEA